jgi:class 3 adenylate cyclase
MGSSRDARRVAAIAFADVVGYSTLMAADEHGTYARWMALLHGVIEPETGRHGGRMLHVAGDGILLEFPKVDDAVDWARAVQQRVRARLEGPETADPLPIALRIAVHIGEVFESGSQIFGDAVNFAARLQAHAAPGGIVISERAREALGTAARASEFRDLGFAELRGFDRRARIFGIESEVVQVAAAVQGSGGMPSVAVLPLLDQGDDPEQAYIADGFAEDVAMSLAGLHELFVVSTASSAIFRGRFPDPREVGRALGVRYALLGRLRRMPGGYGVSVPSYPSGHAIQSFLIARCLEQVVPVPLGTAAALPDGQSPFRLLAERIAKLREVLGVHYPSDTRAGRRVAGLAFSLMMRCARIAGTAVDANGVAVPQLMDAAGMPVQIAGQQMYTNGWLARARNEWAPRQ